MARKLTLAYSDDRRKVFGPLFTKHGIEKKLSVNPLFWIYLHPHISIKGFCVHKQQGKSAKIIENGGLRRNDHCCREFPHKLKQFGAEITRNYAHLSYHQDAQKMSPIPDCLIIFPTYFDNYTISPTFSTL